MRSGSDIEELKARLDSVQDSLSDLVERQRLSRFDTVIFFVYPAMLAAIGLAGNLFVQMSKLQAPTLLFGAIQVEVVVSVATVVFAFGLVTFFTGYIRAYVADDIRRRVWYSRSLITLVAYPILPITTNVLGPLLVELFHRPSLYFTASFFGTLCFAAYAFFDGLSFKFTYSNIMPWFEKNLPRKWAEAKRQRDWKFWFPVEAAQTRFTIARAAWVILTVLFGLQSSYDYYTSGLPSSSLWTVVAICFFLGGSTAFLILRALTHPHGLKRSAQV
jgi:hypothetical protein